MGYREDGSPIVGKAALDTQTGQMVRQGGQAPRNSISRAEVEQAATEDGVSPEAYIRQLEARGVSISG